MGRVLQHPESGRASRQLERHKDPHSAARCARGPRWFRASGSRARTRSDMSESPIARRVLDRMHRQARSKIVDLAAFRAGNEFAEALQNTVVTPGALKEMHPAHAIYVATPERPENSGSRECCRRPWQHGRNTWCSPRPMYSFHQMPQAGPNASIESPRKIPLGPAPRRSNGTSNGERRAATGRNLFSRDTSITSQAQFFSRDCPTFPKVDPIPGSM